MEWKGNIKKVIIQPDMTTNYKHLLGFRKYIYESILFL